MVLAALNAHAGLTIYTDRASWETAAGGGTGDLFDDLNGGSIIAGTINRTNYVVTGEALAFFPNANPQTTIDGTGYIRPLLEGTNGAAFNFTSSILALGYDINPQNFDLGGTVNIWTNSVLAGSYSLPATDVNAFVGFVFSAPVTLFEISTPNEAWHGIDNLEAYHATIPEPSPLALGAVGAVVACVSKRRRE
jgi:hypothetical protein